MKKIMFGLAAAIAMVAAADIVSSNIVGYTKATSVAGLSFITPNFVVPGANTIKLGDITLNGDAVTSFGDNVQILDADGNAATSYAWTAAGDVFENACWIDADFADASGTILDRGLALLFSNESAGVEIVDAGEVSEEAYTMKSVVGLSSIGNPFAHAIKLGQITLSGDNVTSFGDNVQILDADGNAATSYAWTAAGDVFENACWIDADFADASNVEVPAGLGLLLSTENAGVDVMIASGK